MDLPKRFRLAGVIILGAGLLAGAAIYMKTTPDDETGVTDYVFENGKAYPVKRGVSKRELYEMEKMGGKASVFATEITTWFGSLWHGRKLAYTLVVLSVAASGLCFLLGHHLIDLPEADEQIEQE